MGTPPLPPCLHTQTPPLSTRLPEWYICNSEPTLSCQNHPKSIVYMRIHSWCTSYEFGKMCNDMSPPLSYHTGWIHCLKKSPAFYFILRFPDSSAGKDSACNAGDLGSILGLGRSAGEEMGYPLQYSWASLVAQLVKNLPAMWETWVRSLVGKTNQEKGKATHSSILAWRIPWTV